MEILVVCTANRCRSPMAAALLQRQLTLRGFDATVGSAGFGPSGEPATPETVAVMSDRDFDLTGHLSTTATAALCARSDLVVGMTRHHVMELAVLDPGAWPRTFTLVDLVRRGRHNGPRPVGESPNAWVDGAHRGRRTADVLASPFGDDIADPIGQSIAAFRRTRDQLDGLVTDLAHLLVPTSTGTNRDILNT